MAHHVAPRRPGEATAVEREAQHLRGFECNICLDVAQHPVVTPCGHLYCWTCLYRWMQARPNACPCPVCKAHVLEKQVRMRRNEEEGESGTNHVSDVEADASTTCVMDVDSSCRCTAVDCTRWTRASKMRCETCRIDRREGARPCRNGMERTTNARRSASRTAHACSASCWDTPRLETHTSTCKEKQDTNMQNRRGRSCSRVRCCSWVCSCSQDSC